MAGKVFISHAAEASARCAVLARVLEAWGVDVWFTAHATQVGQQLSQQEQEALAESSVLLRVCTRTTRQSYLMSMEAGAFVGLQADERRAGRDERQLINLILDPAYTLVPFDRTTTLIDAMGGKHAQWVNELRAALGLPPLGAPSTLSAELFAPAGISRRQVLAMGIGVSVAVVAAGGVGGAILLRQRKPGGPTIPTVPTPPVRDTRLRWVQRIAASSDRSGAISAAPLAQGGMLYVGTQDGRFAALDTTGAVKWSQTNSDSNGIWQPAVAIPSQNLIVYAIDGPPHIVACDATTGAIRWQATGDTFSFTCVATAGDTLYATGYTEFAFVCTLNLSDGKIDRSIGTNNSTLISASQPLITANAVYESGNDGYLYAIDLSANGGELWAADEGHTKQVQTATKDSNYSRTKPALAADLGLIFTGSDDTNVYAFDVRTGARRWSYLTGNVVASSPAVSAGTVFIGSADHNVYALDAATGTLKWQYHTGDQVNSSPLVANGHVYIGSRDKYVYALDPASGVVVTKYPTSGPVVSQPVIADGVLYISSLDGYLYAYQL